MTVAKRTEIPAAVVAGRRLRALEIVEAAVLVDLVIAICLVARFLPLGWLLTVPAAVPAAVLAARWRLRAGIAAIVAAIAVAVLIGGTGFAITITSCMMTGTLLGTAHRRRWGLLRTAAASVGVLWVPVALVMDAMFGVLTELRTLVLAEIVNSWDGARTSIARLGMAPDNPGLAAADSVVHWGATHWWALLPTALLANTAVNVLATAVLTRPVLRHLAAGAPSARTDHPNPPAWFPAGRRSAPGQPDPHARSQRPDRWQAHPHAQPCPQTRPLPLRLESVAYRYPGASRDAVHDVSLTIWPAEFVAILGANGSGKSTLARIIGGWSPTSGRVLRPGDCALGRPGGTSMIFQRPESQVLGVRVRDDIVWGLADGGQAVDVEALLAKVGLAQLADHETATLSGGQLQRLAVAAALARAPSLLVSDESTAMVDADGRQQLTELLARLPDEEGVAVVHVTHRRAEAMRAHRRIMLDSGRMTPADGSRHSPLRCAPADPCPNPRRPAGPPGAIVTAGTSPLVCLDGVGQVYSSRSPWAHRALTDVSFQLDSGESIIIGGRNGSGKSTLAAVLAGLLSPSEGDARMSGRPLTACPGEIGLAVQHSRLQLLAPTVGADVRAAAGVSAAAADDALAAVGLDPALFRDRRVENLSGGQMRRAALAGLIARRPRLMILDEPLAGLDTPSRHTLIRVLADLRIRTGLTLVVVSHDFEGLAEVIDRMLVLDAGRVVHDGPFHGDRPRCVPTAGPAATARIGSHTLPQPRRAPLTARAQRSGIIGTAGPHVPPLPLSAPAPAPAPAPVTVAASQGQPPSPSPSPSEPSEPDVPVPATSRHPHRLTRRRSAARARRTEPNLLRYIPGTSPVHRLWAGTKLIMMAALGILIALRPSWPVIGLVAGFVGVCLVVARIPPGAAPRLPRWFWYGLLIGAALTMQSREAPFMAVAGVQLSLGGLMEWLRLTSVSMTMFATAALLGWTTPLSDVAPALDRLMTPLRRLRLPVDEWVATVALAIRCLPLLVDEIRTLLAVRRLRTVEGSAWPRRPAALARHARCATELLCTAIVTCLRRAAEMTDAITARGGFGAVSHQPARPRRADVAALAAVAGLFTAALLI